MKKRAEYVRQWTQHTKSDHEALFVLMRVRKRKGAWVELLVVTANMGGRFDREDLIALRAEATHSVAKGRFVICLQEGSSENYVHDVAKRYGMRYIAGTGRVGQKATPLLAGYGIDVHEIKWVRTLAKRFIGQGAGPDHNKDKWSTVRSRMDVLGVPISVSSVHSPASQHFWRRYAATLQEARLWVRVMTSRKRVVIVAGDVNSDWKRGRFARWLRDRGVTSNHAELGEVETHGSRSIDAVLTAKRLVR